MNTNISTLQVLEQGNVSLNRWSMHMHKQLVCRSHSRNLFGWLSSYEQLVSHSYSVLLVLDIPCQPEQSMSEAMTKTEAVTF